MIPPSGHVEPSMLGARNTLLLIALTAIAPFLSAQQTPHQTVLADGWHTTPEEATKLEARLAADPENLAIRTQLISYYTQYIIPDRRAAHVLWLIEHHPDADIFAIAQDLTITEAHYAGLNSPETIERGRALWLRQAERFSSN